MGIGQRVRTYILISVAAMIGVYGIYSFFIPILDFVQAINFHPEKYQSLDQMVTFTSKYHNFSMKYPDSLIPYDIQQGEHRDPEIIVVFGSHSHTPIIEIARRDLEDDVLEVVTEWSLLKSKSGVLLQDISHQKYSTTEHDGNLREYVRQYWNIWGLNIEHCIDWDLINNRKGYHFTFCIDEKNWIETKNIFILMINSIRFD